MTRHQIKIIFLIMCKLLAKQRAKMQLDSELSYLIFQSLWSWEGVSVNGFPRLSNTTIIPTTKHNKRIQPTIVAPFTTLITILEQFLTWLPNAQFVPMIVQTISIKNIKSLHIMRLGISLRGWSFVMVPFMLKRIMVMLNNISRGRITSMPT